MMQKSQTWSCRHKKWVISRTLKETKIKPKMVFNQRPLSTNSQQKNKIHTSVCKKGPTSDIWKQGPHVHKDAHWIGKWRLWAWENTSLRQKGTISKTREKILVPSRTSRRTRENSNPDKNNVQSIQYRTTDGKYFSVEQTETTCLPLKCDALFPWQDEKRSLRFFLS